MAETTLASKVTDGVQAGKAAITAVVDAFEEFRAMLAAAGPYMAERVADLDDLRNRTIATLLGVPMPGVPDPGHPFVLVALDLAPADTATLDAERVRAIVTEEGGPTSHTAILAKSLGIPAVVTCHGATAIPEGEKVLVDGTEGSVIVAPDEATVTEALDAEQRKLAALLAVSGPGRTSDGHPVQLLVNIAGDKDLAPAAAADSEGVGLFRTEFLFLDRPNAPTLEQTGPSTSGCSTPSRAARWSCGHWTPAPTAAGVRHRARRAQPGPRRTRAADLAPAPELLEEQLTAVANAAAASEAQVWVMAPMVSTTAEAAAFAEQVRGHGLASGGVMVEVPAAAIRARHVAAVCDFMSIGTNDLSQYTYAADRMAGELADLLDAWQPALLDLVRMTAEAGKALGKPVGVCGEAASDPLLALVFVGLGITSLSMAPVSIPGVRAAVAGHTLAECRGLATLALDAEDGRDARNAVGAATRA